MAALAHRYRPAPPDEPPVPVARAAAVGPIDLNRASAAELEALPRVGPALARRIVDDREANGPFRSIDELDRVRGIGPRTIELLRPLVTATVPAP